MATKTLYVGNVPFSSTEASLAAAFAPYGGSKVRIIEGRGFAFVEVAEDQMNSAIESMNGKSLEGRALTVNEARPREFGGGNSGGGNSSSSSGGTGGGGNNGKSRGARW